MATGEAKQETTHPSLSPTNPDLSTCLFFCSFVLNHLKKQVQRLRQQGWINPRDKEYSYKKKKKKVKNSD